MFCFHLRLNFVDYFATRVCYLPFFYIEFRQVRLTEQERIIGELGRGLQQAGIKGDRRLVEHQKKYEQRIQFLMNKLRDAELNETPDERIRYLIEKRNNNPGHI